MFRKIIALVLIVILLVPSLSNAEAESPTVFLDGKKLEFDVSPTIVNGSTLVPLRVIFEAQGASISWDNDTQTVTAQRDTLTIRYSIGEKYATVSDGNENRTVNLAQPGQIINSRTMVPLRFVSESLGSFVGWEQYSRIITISSQKKIEGTVVEVVDGDTVKIVYKKPTGEDVSESIRLIGVDTPETVHPSIPTEPYGKEASDFTKNQLKNGMKVFVEMDVSERDKYGRLLGYVYFADGKQFNAELLAQGYARTATFPPNVRWVDMYIQIQRNAAEAKRGLWDLPTDQTGSTPEEKAGTQPFKGEVIDNSPVVIKTLYKGSEEIVLVNISDKEVDITGWKIVSVRGNQTFTFPKFTVRSSQEVSVLSGTKEMIYIASGDNDENVFLWGYPEYHGVGKWESKEMPKERFIWNNDESDPAELYNVNGQKVSELKN